MKYENIKSVILTILVGISVLLTWNLMDLSTQL